MRIFKTKGFQHWASKEGLTDESLRMAVTEMEHGLIDASLGSNVFKKRVALHGRGKRAGARTLVAFRQEDKIFFIYGFAKNQKDNVSRKELDTLKKLASHLLNNSDTVLRTMIFDNELIEVDIDERFNT